MAKETDQPKGKTGYYATNLDPHETLYLETNEDGTVSIKYYEYKDVINWTAFAKKLNDIESALNTNGYYLQGRVDRSKKQVIEAEVKENAKLEPQITVKGQDADEVTKKYVAKRKELGKPQQ